MKITMYGKTAIRKGRDTTVSEIQKSSTDPTSELNADSVLRLFQQLFNHIEDLEDFIASNADHDIYEGGDVDSSEVHFSEDMFKV